MKLTLRAAVFGMAGVAIIGLVALMAWGLRNKGPVTAMSGITRVGEPAADFTLPLSYGEELVLADWIGRPIVINFWASWCIPCREEARGLERTWRSYMEQGVLFVGVNIQDAEKNALDHMNEFGLTYPHGRDVDGKITVDYGVIGLPVTFFINRNGIVEKRWVGAIPEAILVAWVDGLVSGQGPEGQAEGADLDRFLELNKRP